MAEDESNLDRLQMESELKEAEAKVTDLRSKLGDNKKIMKRSRWNALDVKSQGEYLSSGGKIIDD